MSVEELLKELHSLPTGAPVNFPAIRERIHDEFDAATTGDDRATLLGIYAATANLVERTLTGDDLAKFREARRQDYALLLAKECLVGENVCVETLYAVTGREIAAGRMSEDHSLRQIAKQGMAAPHPTRSQLIVMAEEKKKARPASSLMQKLKDIFGKK